ncbi:MAG: PIG-L family deacetylase [Corynebacterium sp.]|nr:PIG-L family deacetylase [Corynebacterium sp.]
MASPHPPTHINPALFASTTVLAVHAHPDDEAIFTGGVLATAAQAGADVHVVTATLGEEGETFGTQLAGLVADHADQLGGYRYHELVRSLSILRATGHFLGGAGYWRDSGMEGPTRPHRRCALIDSGEEALHHLQAVVDEIRPDILITYDEYGTYGHRDHIRVYDLFMGVSLPANTEVWCVVTDPDDLAASQGRIVAAPWPLPQPGEIMTSTAATHVLALDASGYRAKVAAMQAHETQIWFADGTVSPIHPDPVTAQGPDAVYCLTNRIARAVSRQEFFHRVR